MPSEPLILKNRMREIRSYGSVRGRGREAPVNSEVYGPALGQFFTRDPIGYVGGMGLYGGYFGTSMANDTYGLADQAGTAGAKSPMECCQDAVKARLKGAEGLRPAALSVLQTETGWLIGYPAVNPHCYATVSCKTEKDCRLPASCGLFIPAGKPGDWSAGTKDAPSEIQICLGSGCRDYERSVNHEVQHFVNMCDSFAQIGENPRLSVCARCLCDEMSASRCAGQCPAGDFDKCFERAVASCTGARPTGVSHCGDRKTALEAVNDPKGTWKRNCGEQWKTRGCWASDLPPQTKGRP